MHCEKLTYSGKLLDIDFYPVFGDGRRVPCRPKSGGKSTEAQKKYNHAMRVKKVIRFVNANFDVTDYYMHPTYSPDKAPATKEEAERDITNWLRRVKRRRQSRIRELKLDLAEAETTAAASQNNKALLRMRDKLRQQIAKLESPFKFYYATERIEYKKGPMKGKPNWHFHMFITGGLDNSEMEDMWDYGMYADCKNFRPDLFGPERAAAYIAKETGGGRTIHHSRNLTTPDTRRRKSRIGSSGMERMASRRVDDAAYWEKRYPGYRFVRCYPRYNEYNGYWYISVVMYKTAGIPPRWGLPPDIWVTEGLTAT